MALSAASGADLQAVQAVKQVTWLDIEAIEPADSATLWKCLSTVSSTLETLTLEDTFLYEDESIGQPPSHIEFPVLEELCMDGSAFKAALHFPRSVSMPALRTIRVARDMEAPNAEVGIGHHEIAHQIGNGEELQPHPVTQWYQCQINELEAFITLDSSLPVTCQDRVYSIVLQASISMIRSFFEIISPLASQGFVDLHVHWSTRVHNAGPQLAGGLASAVAAVPAECRPSILTMSVMVEETLEEMASQAAEAATFEFPNLYTLSITNAAPLAASPSISTETWLKQLRMHKLKTLWLYTGQSSPVLYIQTVRDRLSTWPELSEVNFVSFHKDPTLQDSAGYLDLVGACRERQIRLAFETNRVTP